MILKISFQAFFIVFVSTRDSLRLKS